MAKVKHTTIILNESIQKFKDELSPIYGLKNIISAGLLLFSRLSDTEQKKTIAEVNRLEAEDVVAAAEELAKEIRQKQPRRSSKAG